MRLIRSRRAGVGKSLQKQKLLAHLDEMRKTEEMPGGGIIIPLYKTVNTDRFMSDLLCKLGRITVDIEQTYYNLIHIDVAREVCYPL